MAKTVYEVHKYALDDGTEIVLKPLVISRMRKFMEVIDSLPGLSDVYEMQEALVEAAAICLEKHNPAVVADRENFADNIDMETIYKILDICGGVRLNDPNLIQALEKSAEAEKSGQN